MVVNAHLESRVQPELDPGEYLLWVGQPSPRRFLRESLSSFGLGIVWTAFIVNFIIGWYSFPHGELSVPSGLFGLRGILSSIFFVPFILVGIGMLLSPVRSYRSAKRTVYAITNKRALIVEGAGSRSVQSYGEGEISNIERVERADGSGDMTLVNARLRTIREGSARARITGPLSRLPKQA